MRRPTAAHGPAPAGQAGFTLLELLVALALVALISVVLTGGIHFGARVWEASRIQTESASEILAIRRFVRERLLAARPVRAIGDDKGEGTASLSGNSAALRLVTLMPAYAARGGLYHFELAATAGDGRTALTAKWWPYGGAEAGPGSGQRRLLDGIEDFRISYFGAPGSSDAMAWYDDWRDLGALPRLISIKIAFPAGDARVWPELIVALPTSNGATNALSRR